MRGIKYSKKSIKEKQQIKKKHAKLHIFRRRRTDIILAIPEDLFIFLSFSTQIYLDELTKLKFVMKHILMSSIFCIRQRDLGLLAQDSPESLFYVLLYSILSAVQIKEERKSPHMTKNVNWNVKRIHRQIKYTLR